jgi:hypothetical protein
MQIKEHKPTESNDTPKKWYREFWAWFILTPLIVVVIVSTFTVTVAVRNADDRVLDNYYKEGRMINMRIDEDLVAAQLQLTADMTIDQTINELAVVLRSVSGVFPEVIVVEFSHPSDQDLDHTILLTHIAKGQYQAELSRELLYRWYLRISPQVIPEDGKQWRLRGEIDLVQQSSVRLSAEI